MLGGGFGEQGVHVGEIDGDLAKVSPDFAHYASGSEEWFERQLL